MAVLGAHCICHQFLIAADSVLHGPRSYLDLFMIHRAQAPPSDLQRQRKISISVTAPSIYVRICSHRLPGRDPTSSSLISTLVPFQPQVLPILPKKLLLRVVFKANHLDDNLALCLDVDNIVGRGLPTTSHVLIDSQSVTRSVFSHFLAEPAERFFATAAMRAE
ncbi:hypothetical protein HO173_013033 [Letharia columbiana]|uniref:Uncharacterized protein n=1 Tax=Letharia columbiana TaxID=112416 RepID=A0A8H6CJV3_9LECA|nr:uncharacterized protein HO173_013033 [Letharia columbiana]KAF6224544.1 hypothetical protein HO173_013033 [Letharia columbiana]